MAAVAPLWVKIPCDLFDCPENLGLSESAANLLIRCWLYSGRFTTDGLLPERVVSMLAGDKPGAITELDEMGAISRSPDGWVVRGFTDFNATSAERAAFVEQCRRAGKRSAAGRQPPVERPVEPPVDGPVQRPVDQTSTQQEQEQEHKQEQKRGAPDGAPRPRPAGRAPSPSRSAILPEERQPVAACQVTPPSKALTVAQQIWEFYATMYRVEEGADPTAQGHYFVQLNRLLKIHPPDEIKRRIGIYFTGPPFSLREGARDFGRFLKGIDLLARKSGGTAADDLDRLCEREKRLEELRQMEELGLPIPESYRALNGVNGHATEP